MHLRLLLLCAAVGLAMSPGGPAFAQPPAPPAGLKVVGEYDSGSETVASLAYSPDGKYLAVGTGKQLVVWDVAGHKIRSRWTHPYANVLRTEFTEVERSGVAVASTQTSVVLLNPVTGEQVGKLDLNVGNQVLDGFAVGQEHRLIVGAVRNRLSLWEAGTPTAKWNVECAGELIESLTVSPDGQAVAVLHDGGAVGLYRTSDGKELRRIPWQGGRAPARRGFSYTRRGDELLIADRDSSRLRVIDLNGGDVKRDVTWEHRQPPHPGGRRPVGPKYDRTSGIEALAHSPDGTTVALLCNDETVRLYETLTWGLRHVAAVKGIRLAFTPDSRHIAVGGYKSGRVAVYDWRKPDTPLGASKSADELWQLLGSPDAAIAFRAVTELAATPATAVAAIGERLKPIRELNEAEAARLVVGLGAKDFPEREAATAALGRAGIAAEPALRKAVATTNIPEVRARAGRLLTSLSRRASPERLRFARAVELLEYWATPAALAVLRELASGVRSVPETEDARAALARAETARPQQ